MAALAVVLGSVPFADAQSTWVRRLSNTIEYLSGVTHGGGTWVAVGEKGAVVRSPDAANWSPAGSGTDAALRAVVHSHGQFFAAGQGGVVISSPDGVSWAAKTSGVTAFLSGLASNGSLLVAVGASGTILTSPDGVAWTAAPSGTTAFLQDVHHAAGLFVAVGEGGMIRTSADGMHWSAANSPTSSYLVGGGHFAGRHFAVGQNGRIISSTDGMDWDLGVSGTVEWLRAFTTDGTTAVICGDVGTLLTSTDGTNWSPVSSGQTVILDGATFADNRFVVVGEPAGGHGMILVADRNPGILWTAPSLAVNEADGSVTLFVKRLGPTSAAASINYQTAAGTAAADGDFTTASGTAEFAAGASTTGIVVAIANNPEAEPAETFTVTLSNPAPAGLTLYHPHVATVTIIDAQDSDYDGLPDDWEILYFETIEAWGPDDDPDGDGNSNQRELADGTDPSDPASANYLLNLGVAAGLGLVAASPDLASYPVGTTVSVTPTATAPFTFASWQGGATGTAEPLVFDITGDLAIDAVFEVTLAEALDEPVLDWSLGGSGPPWVGQVDVTSDGVDAAAIGGLAVGEQSSILSTVYGPASIGFDWKVSCGPYDTFRFHVGSSPRATIVGNVDWRRVSVFIGAGAQPVRWTFTRSSTVSGGTNQAWVDQVSLSYGFNDWQLAYFNATERADPAISGPAADPDADGVANLIEYLCNLNPDFADAASPHLPAIEFVESGGQSFPALSWSQHRYRAETLSVVVEFSATLEPGSWQPLVAPILPISTSGALETVRWTSPNPSSTTPRGFFRLRVSLLP